MKLIVVQRAAVKTYERLRRTFADDPNVRVVRERRTEERRKESDSSSPAPHQRGRDRRLLKKPWNDQGYFVIELAKDDPRAKPAPLRDSKDPWHGSK